MMISTQFRFCCTLLFLLLYSTAAYSQKNMINKAPALQEVTRSRVKSEKISLDFDKMSFEGACARISAICHLNLIADDVPKNAEFSIKFNGVASALLDKLSNCFDYRWNVGKKGDIMMHRQYFDESEYPQCHLLEFKQISKEMQDLFAAANLYSGPRAYAVYRTEDFYKCLAPEQKKYLRSGAVIHPSELAPDQFKLYRDAVMSYLVGDLVDTWNKTHYILVNLSHSYLRLEKLNEPGERLYLSPGMTDNPDNIIFLRTFHTLPLINPPPVIISHEGP